MSEASELWIVRPGQMPYAEATELQARLADARHSKQVPDVLLLLEHRPVYTKGRRSEPGHLPMGEDWYRMQGIEVCETDRGGQVTYHGPGQLVAYPILDLAGRFGVVDYVRVLERVMIEALGAVGIEAQVFDGLTGVWTAGAPPIAAGEMGPQRSAVGGGTLASEGAEAQKIGSIGIHVNREITTHGLAINVNNDLQPFDWIVPCAIDGVRMTSICRELGAEQDLDRIATDVGTRLASTLELAPTDVEASVLVAAAA